MKYINYDIAILCALVVNNCLIWLAIWQLQAYLLTINWHGAVILLRGVLLEFCHPRKVGVGNANRLVDSYNYISISWQRGTIDELVRGCLKMVRNFNSLTARLSCAQSSLPVLWHPHYLLLYSIATGRSRWLWRSLSHIFVRRLVHCVAVWTDVVVRIFSTV